MPIQSERRCEMSATWIATTPETRYDRANVECPKCHRSLLAMAIQPEHLKVMLPAHHRDYPRYAR